MILADQSTARAKLLRRLLDGMRRGDAGLETSLKAPNRWIYGHIEVYVGK
jgi:hypothetical protein